MNKESLKTKDLFSDPSTEKDASDNDNNKLYLIITNISKPTNIKCLLRLACAFGCSAIFVAGQRKFNFDPDAPTSDIPNNLKAALKVMKVFQFDKLPECVEYVHSLGIQVVGVEIDESSVDIEHAEECFKGGSSTAFMMGNEGQGMNSKQMSLCDRFVKISQYGGGTASLNVSVAAGIVLHRYHQWFLAQR
jgi:tRNA G18 (ribose-2'-O)-methylase SpoU